MKDTLKYENMSMRQLISLLVNSDVSDVEFDAKLKEIFSERIEKVCDEVVDYTIKSLGDKYEEVIESLTDQLEEATKALEKIAETETQSWTQREGKAYNWEVAKQALSTIRGK